MTTTDITTSEAAAFLTSTGLETFTDTRGGDLTLPHALRMLALPTSTARVSTRGRHRLFIDCHRGHGPTVLVLRVCACPPNCQSPAGSLNPALPAYCEACGGTCS